MAMREAQIDALATHLVLKLRLLGLGGVETSDYPGGIGFEVLIVNLLELVDTRLGFSLHDLGLPFALLTTF